MTPSILAAFQEKSLALIPLGSSFLSKDDSLYFLHIQKTAGTSFAALLQTQFAPEETCAAYYYPDLLALPPDQRQAYRYYRGHFGYGLLDYVHKPLRVITMLRDPIERTLSNLDHIRRYPEHIAHQDFHRLGVHDFIEQGHARWELWNLQTNALGMPSNLPDPTEHIECDTATLQLALERLRSLAFTGIVEKYAESLALLRCTLGWRWFPSAVKLNASPDRMRFEDLPSRTQALIIECNRFDLELYAEAKQMFEERFQQALSDMVDAYFLNVIAPRAAEYTFDMRLALPGDGWAEYEGEGSSRWTNAPTATLKARLREDRPYLLRFHIIDVLEQAVLDSLKVTVNGHFLLLQFADHPEIGLEVSGVIMPAMLTSDDPFTTISFEVAHTVNEPVPQQGTDDIRSLGIKLTSIRISQYRGSMLRQNVMWSYRKFKRRFRWVKHTAAYRMVARRSRPASVR